MKKKNIVSLSIGITIGILSINIFADEKESLAPFEKYEQRVADICKPFEPENTKVINDFLEYTNYDTPNSKQALSPELYDKYQSYQESAGKDVLSFDEYKTKYENYIKLGKSLDFEIEKEKYRENMNNIYKCGILQTQIKSLGLITQELTDDIEIKKEMESKRKLLKKKSTTFGCNQSEDIDGLQKGIILQQASYQTCKYHTYIEYLKEKNHNISNIIEDSQKEYQITQVAKIQTQRYNELDAEIEHIYNIFPIAYQAYIDYENNITPHYLLQVVKKDYIDLRKNLHQALNPMNQLVYKFSNATKP